MTSDPTDTFVFVQLPSTAELVVAGRFVLHPGASGSVGRFRYGRSYLARTNAIPLDPVHLPLVGKEFSTALNGGLFGALREAAPDFSGRTVIERGGMPVNALTSNLDDHPRNHAIVWEGEGWRLSPAYDLTPAGTQSQDERLLAMSAGAPGGDAAAGSEPVQPPVRRRHFGLTRDEADEIMSRMKAKVLKRWRPLVTELGGEHVFAERIAHAFPDRYPGFEYQDIGWERQ